MTVLKVSLILRLFSIVMRTIAYCISIVIGWKVEYKFFMEKFLIKSMCVLIPAVLNNNKEVVCVIKRENRL